VPVLESPQRSSLPVLPGIGRLTPRKFYLLYRLGPRVTVAEIQRVLKCSPSTAYDYYNALRYIRFTKELSIR